MTEGKSSGAIVPAGETGLAEPRRSWWQRTLRPTKIRHYVEVRAPLAHGGPGDMPPARHLARREGERSVEGITYKGCGRPLLLTFFVGACSMFVGMFVSSHWLMFGGFAAFFAAFIGMSAVIDSKRLRRHIFKKYPNESREILEGMDTLALLADGSGAEIYGANPVELPVESLFCALAHEDEDIRRYAAGLIKGLPPDLLVECFFQYRPYLTFKQMQLFVPGLESVPEDMIPALDRGVRPLPNYPRTITEPD